MKQNLIQLTKNHFLRTFEKADPNVILYTTLPNHVQECEKWVNKILEHEPKANKEILLMSVWLHDIGQAFPPKEKDHAIKSEEETSRFLLEIGMEPETVKKITHCVRAHRNKDVKPETLEAKLLAAADAASHMTDVVYIKMINEGTSKKEVMEKFERDIRDIQNLPETLLKEIVPLNNAWKKLLEVFPE